MRKKIVAGNWKMNLTLQEGTALIENILAGLQGINDDKQVVIAPPFTHLSAVGNSIRSTQHVYLGAQNCNENTAGAYTGEVSAAMLKSVDVAYVIIGHSERREYYKEYDTLLARKTSQALANNVKVIFCCGEPLAVRDAETQNEHVANQIKAGLFHMDATHLKNVVLAYEPIWAIGTGRTATSAQAQEMHAHIRSVMAAQYGVETANDMTILYGGSCKPSNAAELFACPDVDGGLIGGAALKAEEFLGIIAAMAGA
jgi:triosephosphate isomerase